MWMDLGFSYSPQLSLTQLNSARRLPQAEPARKTYYLRVQVSSGTYVGADTYIYSDLLRSLKNNWGRAALWREAWGYTWAILGKFVLTPLARGCGLLDTALGGNGRLFRESLVEKKYKKKNVFIDFIITFTWI